MYSEDEDSQEDQYVNYKQKYRELKKNLRYLIYENECFQDELRKAQHNFVSISRDKSFLLDRILKFEKPQGHSSDSEATESSDEEEETSKSIGDYYQLPTSFCFSLLYLFHFVIAEMASASAHFMNQRKKITKRKRSEAEMHNGTGAAAPPESMHSQISTKQVPLKPIATKPVSGKGNLLVKKPKKPPAVRKPPVKKEKDMSKNSNERNLINTHVMKSYEMDNMHIANEEQGKIIAYPMTIA